MLNGAIFFGHVKKMLYLCTVKKGKAYPQPLPKGKGVQSERNS